MSRAALPEFLTTVTPTEPAAARTPVPLARATRSVAQWLDQPAWLQEPRPRLSLAWPRVRLSVRGMILAVAAAGAVTGMAARAAHFRALANHHASRVVRLYVSFALGR